MNNYNNQIKMDSLMQQMNTLQQQKKLLEEQMNQPLPMVQNNYLPSTPQYELVGEFRDDIYSIKKWNEGTLYMDKEDSAFMMNGKYYKFQEFNPKSELQSLREENEKLKKQIKQKEDRHESVLSEKQQPDNRNGYEQLTIEKSKWLSTDS